MLLPLVMVPLATAVCGAMILAAAKPAVAEWFRTRRLISVALTLLSAVPIGLVLGTGVAVLIGVAAGVWSSFQR
jgi:hypothetical protein